MANVPGLVTDPSRIKGGLVHVTSGGAKIPAYLATPNEAGNYPGIVVIHEAFGLADHICDLARRFANIGYNAIAPDLYWKQGAPKDPSDMNSVLPVMFALQDRQAIGDLEASADYLRALAGATGKVGAIGFCSGGRHTLLFACKSSKVDAAVDCWGGFIHRATPTDETTASRPVAVLDLVKNLHCPVFGVFGEEDQNPAVGLAAELGERATKAGKDVTTKIYKGAGHAFLADYRPSYREAPAHELWNDATGFFAKHLR
ncbi:MAG TPA: dienelactone hydrolase family protein [Stellaceae bacterium]|jgi:carboxymethylenebutenolidase|nr:dienelactone hydrolase family protein [Stellaceae bacterium]